MKTAFIGHRKLFTNNIDKKLTDAIQAEIDNGCRVFTMGTHGEFDCIALNICRRLRETCTDLEIEVVITSLNCIRKGSEFDSAPYSDVKTFMYNIEEAHYKQQITLSNRNMIDSCDTLICYVDTSEYRSGAKTVLRYAERRGLKIVNLYREEDKLFYGMTKAEIDALTKEIFAKIDKK